MSTSDTQVFCSCLISEASESHTAEQSVYWLQEAARIIDEQQRELATAQRDINAFVNLLGYDDPQLAPSGRVVSAVAALLRMKEQLENARLDSRRLDWLEELFSTTANDSKTWREFSLSVTERGYRAAIDAAMEART